MSFFSDLFKGDFGNLGHDLNPSNIFSDFGSDASKAVSNPYVDAAALAAIALPFVAPAIGAGLGGLGATLGVDSAAGAAATAAPLDLSAAASSGGALGFAGDVGGGATDLTSFLANPAGVAGGTAASAPLSISPSLATGGLDLSTIGQGVSATGGAVADASAPLNLAATGGSAAGTAASGGGGILSTISNTLAPVSNTLKTVAPVIGLGGLGANLYEGYEQKQALNQLNATEQGNAATAARTAATENAAAQPLLSSGQTLMSYLTTGTLPQAFQSQVDQQIAAAKASVIQGYAARGQNTNPQQNSALAQDLSNVDMQAQSLKANLESTLSTAGQQMTQTANSLLASGISATQLSSEIPIQVAQLNSNLNQQMATAISNFSAALNGSGVKSNAITLQLPNNVVSNSGSLSLNG